MYRCVCGGSKGGLNCIIIDTPRICSSLDTSYAHSRSLSFNLIQSDSRKLYIVNPNDVTFCLNKDVDQLSVVTWWKGLKSNAKSRFCSLDMSFWRSLIPSSISCRKEEVLRWMLRDTWRTLESFSNRFDFVSITFHTQLSFILIRTNFVTCLKN